MYLGGALLFVGMPPLLGSSYGLAIGFAMVLLLTGRIIGEERLLARELDDTKSTGTKSSTGSFP